MNAAVMLFAVIVGAVLHAALPAAWLGGTPLNPMLGIVIYYALMHGRLAMLGAAIVAGLIEDGMGMMPLGYSSFAYCLVGWMVEEFREVVLVREVPTHVLFGSLGACCSSLAEWLLLVKDGLVQPEPLVLLIRLLGSALAAAIVVPLVFALMVRIDTLVGNLEEVDA